MISILFKLHNHHCLIQNGYKLNITSVAAAKLEKMELVWDQKFDKIDYIKKCRVI
jgi:hypothetical protein